MPVDHQFDYLGAMLTSLKFLGILVSGAGAIVGATPDKANKKASRSIPNSKLGRTAQIVFSKQWALRWVVIGLFVSFLSQSVETIKTTNESAEAAGRALRQDRATQATLDDLRRVLSQQGVGSVMAQLSLSLTNRTVVSELAWVNKVPRQTKDLKAELPGYPGLVIQRLTDGRVDGVTVFPNSPYHPFQVPRSALAELLENLVISLVIFRPTNSAPEETQRLLVEVQKEDEVGRDAKLESAMTWIDRTTTYPSAVPPFTFDLEKGEMRFWIKQLLLHTSTLRGLNSNQLAGTFLRIMAEAESRTDRKPLSPAFDSLRKALKINLQEIYINDFAGWRVDSPCLIVTNSSRFSEQVIYFAPGTSMNR